LKGLGVGDPDQNVPPVFLGQFFDPGGKKEIVLPYFLGILIEVLIVPLVLQLQADLARDAVSVKSSGQKPRDEGNDFEKNRFHGLWQPTPFWRRIMERK
jgi:hypothetical protein